MFQCKLCVQKGKDCVCKSSQAVTIHWCTSVNHHVKGERTAAPPLSSGPTPSAAQQTSPSFSTSPGSEPSPAPLSPSYSPHLKCKEHITTPPTTGPLLPSLSYHLPPQDEPLFT